jgi:preprotein translocase subunit SecE
VSVADGRSAVKGSVAMKDKIINFFTDVVKEMKKVTWPKKDDLRDSTIIVLVVCLIVAGFVYLVDTAISLLLQQILQ